MQISSFVAFACVLAFSLPTKAEKIKRSPKTKSPLETMTTEQKVGQLMIWTFPGADFNSQTEEILSKYQLGALIAFSRNIKSTKQIARFNSQAQNFANKKLKAPLLLMVDQEGGTVTRVKVGTPIPSALALGRMENAQFVESYAKINAELLTAIGFNVNLSPVMDISNPDNDSFIANRVFGSNPDHVTETSMAFARGISSAGMLPTAKHFPGHGGMVTDSHKTTPKKFATIEDLEQRDLVPFVEYIHSKFPRALMMAHMSLPNIDPSGVPATYSNIIIQDLLRAKYGYNGLVVTDDLEMNGASISADLGERAVRAFLAGNDMLMLAGPPKNQRLAFDSMVAAVNTGRISKKRLDESVARILDIKSQIKPMAFKFQEQKSLDIKTKIEALSREVMEKNFQDANESKTSEWPAVTPKTRVVVFGSDARFFRGFKENFTGRAKFVRLSPETLADVPNEIANRKNTLAVFYASGSKTAKWVSKLPKELRGKTIVINCNNPGKIQNQAGFLNVLNINSPSPESGGWLAQALSNPPDVRTPATANESEAPEDAPAIPIEQPQKPEQIVPEESAMLSPVK